MSTKSDYRQAALVISSAVFLLFYVPVYATESGKLGDAPFEYRQTVDKDTLWKISRVLKTQGVSINQVMVATLRRNPDAFVHGNVCDLRKGVALTIPSLPEVMAEPLDKANALIQSHEKAYGTRKKASTPPVYPLEGAAKPAPVVKPAAPVAPPPAPVTEPAKPAAPAAVTPPPVVPPAPEPAKPTVTTPEPAKPAVPEKPAVPVTPVPEPAAPAVKPAAPVVTPVPATPASSETAPATAPFRLADLLPWLGGILMGALGFVLYRIFGVSRQREAETAKKKPRVEVSDEGLRNVRVLESIEATAALVNHDVAAPVSLPPPTSDAELKLRMAEAYLQLDRKDAARTVLHEVLAEGGSDAKARAHELLARCV